MRQVLGTLLLLTTTASAFVSVAPGLGNACRVRRTGVRMRSLEQRRSEVPVPSSAHLHQSVMPPEAGPHAGGRYKDQHDEDEDDDVWVACVEALDVAKQSCELRREPVRLERLIPGRLLDRFSEAAEGCKLDFTAVPSESRISGEDYYEALLVKMVKIPHQTAVNVIGAQCYIEATRRFFDERVRPLLLASGGDQDVPAYTDPVDGTERGARIIDPDMELRVAGDPRSRVVFEVDFKNKSPGPQAERVAEMFAGFEMLRKVVTIKFYDRRQDGRFIAVCVVYGKHDDGTVHVQRAFDVGTAPSTAIKRTAVRLVWDANGWTLDAAVDDGTPDGFTITPYDFGLIPAGGRFPERPPSQAVREHFQVIIDESEMYYGAEALGYRPPDKPTPFVLDLYRVLWEVDKDLL